MNIITTTTILSFSLKIKSAFCRRAKILLSIGGRANARPSHISISFDDSVKQVPLSPFPLPSGLAIAAAAAATAVTLRTKNVERGNARRRKFRCGEPGGGAARIQRSRKVRRQGGSGRAAALVPSAPATVVKSGGDDATATVCSLLSG